MKSLNKIITENNLIDIDRWRPVIRRSCATFSTSDLIDAYILLGRKIIPDFTIDASNKFVYENLGRWLTADSSMLALSPEGSIIPGDVNKGIYLCGSTGTGKTTCILLTRMLASIVRPSYQIGGSRMEGLLLKTVSANSICNRFAMQGNSSIEEFITATVLNIEDLGTEPMETVYMGNRVSVLKTILEERADLPAKITCITSNLNPFGKDFQSKYGNRVVSRIPQMCNLIYLNGKDKRI